MRGYKEQENKYFDKNAAFAVSIWRMCFDLHYTYLVEQEVA